MADTEMERLKQRVEAAGGMLIANEETFIGINEIALQLPGCFGGYETVSMESSDNLIELINLALDGLEAKDKARRCVEAMDDALETMGSQYVNDRVKWVKHCQGIIRRKFGIEEEK